MATSNVQLTEAWAKIADDSDEAFLASQTVTNGLVEFATVATDTEPTVDGHVLSSEQQMTRSAIGPGFVFARATAGAVVLVVSK